jgi:hypothetical protein
MADNKISLEVIVNGSPTTVEANINQPLHAIKGKALQQTGNAAGQPPENWEFRDAPGAPIDESKKIGDLGLTNGSRVFLNLKAGVGG